jgi:hypothetical protein
LRRHQGAVSHVVDVEAADVREEVPVEEEVVEVGFWRPTVAWCTPEEGMEKV